MVIVHNNLIEYLRIDKNGKQYHMGKPFSHHYGQIEKLKIDRNSNFLLLISKHTSESEDENVTPEEIKRLHIINRKTLEPVEAFDNIHDILHIDEKNDMTCLDKDGNLI